MRKKAAWVLSTGISVGMLVWLLWPVKMPVETIGTTAVMPKPQSLLILGDSIADGYMDAASGRLETVRELCFGTNLQQALSLDGEHYANRAVSGWTTGNLLQNMQEVTADIQAPDMIAVSIGGNDLLGPLLRDPAVIYDILSLAAESAKGNAENIRAALAQKIEEISERETYRQAVSAARQNLTEILQQLHQRFPQAVVVVQTVYNPLDRSDSLCIPIPALDELNAAIRDVVEGCEWACVLDVAAAFSQRGEELLSSDWIHPNPEGHKQIASLYRELWETPRP